MINVKELFGIASTRSSKRVELVVQLERWDPTHQYERLGLDDEQFDILGLQVPLIRMPVAPGRNIAILVEVAARNVRPGYSADGMRICHSCGAIAPNVCVIGAGAARRIAHRDHALADARFSSFRPPRQLPA